MISKNLRWMAALLMATNMAFITPSSLLAGPKDKTPSTPPDQALKYQTDTPIKHLVVIFQENVSFDHYFATYPDAANPEGETKFKGKGRTPAVNGLTPGLEELNPNSSKPFRLDPSQNLTCSMNHDYMPEQQAFDSGLMDKFPESTSGGGCTSAFPAVASLGPQIVMGYYDGNTVTAEWNYAQNYAMSDNMYGTNFGPSTVGAINVISGMTGGVDPNPAVTTNNTIDDVVSGSVIGDPDGGYDDCSSTDKTGMTGKNIGDLLNAKNISWGWFQGGFTPSAVVSGVAQCNTKSARLDGVLQTEYSAHHNPFEYYLSTSNPHHTAPASLSEVGHNGPANHEYDLSWFYAAAANNTLPAISYLKAPKAEDGHPSNSTPLDEQVFITTVINTLQSLPSWGSTAVIITYDDSDGWYDHVMSPILNHSNTSIDALTGTSSCGLGSNSLEGIEGRCGYGPRLPFLVISPYSRENFVDHSVIDQSSVVKFIEDNWNLPQIGAGSFDQFAGSIYGMFNFNNQRDDILLLDPSTGSPVDNKK